jgi:hypothetical protein
MREQKLRLIQFLKQTNDQSKEERDKRKELRQRYREESKQQKTKGNLASRENLKTKSDVIKETGTYSIRFLFMRIPAGDEVLYSYKRKLQKEIQWRLLSSQAPAVLFGTFLFFLTRRLKKKSSADFLYFLSGWAFINYGMFVEQQHKLFEISYPAHPVIFEKRTHVLNSVCYYHPQIVKNEIEFLHRKLAKAYHKAEEEGKKEEVGE